MKKTFLLAAVLGTGIFLAEPRAADAQILSYTPGGYAGYLPYGGFGSPTFDSRYSYTTPFNPPTYTYGYPGPLGYYSAPYGTGYGYPGYGFSAYQYGYPSYGYPSYGYRPYGYYGHSSGFHPSKFSGGFGLSSSGRFGW